ncbi:hypothetical protein P7K49_000805 [Saguinus oedipus]|uniref:SH3 domain-containing protein n=1 Tax=Saguinus oedipus TaxID=9490 RepID=A0ABQ9WCS4_SAGOE|nr:hypothetical protein P7K49_000805 [Saguinus oedipus]
MVTVHRHSTAQPQPPSESAEKEPEQDGPTGPADGGTVESLPRPLSPTKLTPIEAGQRAPAPEEARLHHRARGPGPNNQKLLYQHFNTLAGGMEGTLFYQPSPSQDFMSTLANVDNGNTNANGNLEEATPAQPTAALHDEPVPSSDANDNELLFPEPEELICPQTTHQTAEPAQDNNKVATVPYTEQIPSPVAEAPPPGEEPRTNWKKSNLERTGHGLRVRFNPLALLLDASLEGEFDLVQRIIYEVEDPSKPNDKGITPLYAGHHHIVKFLLDFGVNVNAADSDGWTPLHCAASSAGGEWCRHFCLNHSNIETAADKCEEMEEGYIQCSQFLYRVQEKLGVMNKGVVYALWDYKAQNSDELSFHEGDALTILRRKDESETEWWWRTLENGRAMCPKTCWGCIHGSNPDSARSPELPFGAPRGLASYQEPLKRLFCCFPRKAEARKWS